MPAAAACVPVAFGTAQECLFTAANLEAGQTVLIHAGAAASAWRRSSSRSRPGATVLSTASSDEKLERLKPLGLDHGINYASESFVERVRELTDGRGADVVLDSVGGKNLVDSVEALAYRGTLVSVGVAGRAGSADRGEVAVDEEQHAARGLPGRRADRRVRAHPPDDRGPDRAGRERRAARRDRPLVPALPRPRRRTNTWRAARPSAGS